MKGLLSCIAAAAMVAAPAAQAQDEAVFRPSGTWTADYGDDYCRLFRTFTDGSRELNIALERLQPGDQMRLIAVGDGLRPFRGAEEIAYRFLPGGASGKSRYVRSDTPDKKQFIGFDPLTLATPAPFTPPAPGAPIVPPVYDRAAELETARAITGFVLTEGLISPVRVETGSLRAPVAALQACADDLLGVWGLDIEKHRTMSAMAVLTPNSSGVLPQGTIPFGEFGKLGGGANQVRLLIGTDGKVTGCTIYSPSLSSTLNERICSLAKERASFQPAKDAAGQPMATVWMGSPMFLGPPFGGARRGGPPPAVQPMAEPVPASDLPPTTPPAVPASPGTPAPAAPPANP